MIKTPSGNYVPMTNVKVVKPLKGGGCSVHLKTGESFKDSRTPEQIFKGQVNSDMTPVITSIYAELAALKGGVASELSSLTSTLNNMTEGLSRLSSTIQSTASSVSSNSAKLDTATVGLGKAQKDIANVTKDLQDAIEEEIQGT